jgi:hypothetical protein
MRWGAQWLKSEIAVGNPWSWLGGRLNFNADSGSGEAETGMRNDIMRNSWTWILLHTGRESGRNVKDGSNLSHLSNKEVMMELLREMTTLGISTDQGKQTLRWVFNIN